MAGFLLVCVFVCSLFVTGSFAIVSVASVAQTTTYTWSPAGPALGAQLPKCLYSQPAAMHSGHGKVTHFPIGVSLICLFSIQIPKMHRSPRRGSTQTTIGTSPRSCLLAVQNS